MDFKNATKFIINSTTKNGVVTQKKYKTKSGFLKRIKSLGLKNLDSVKVLKTSNYFLKSVHYNFIWE